MNPKLEKTSLIAVIAQMPILQYLPRKAQEEIAWKARVIECDQRTILLSQGAEHKYLYLVITGQLDFCGSTREGEEITLASFGPGSVSSWFSVYHTTNSRRDLVACRDSVFLAIPHQLIRTMLTQNPELYPYVIRYEANRVRALLDWQELSLTSDRTRRIALMLIQLAEIKGDKSNQPIVRLTGERLARTTNCSRQTLLASLQKLREANLIKQRYGEVQLLDIPGLRRFGKLA